MKLGLISDIHADFDALETALQRLEKQHQVDKILCAGDLIGYGKQAQAVLNRFRHSALTTVRGNHDMPSKDTSEADAAYLRSLPFSWQGEFNGKRIYLCHGLPNVNFIGYTAELLTKEPIQAQLSTLRVDLLITGHTHAIFCQKSQQTWLINPGSIYSQSPDGTSHSYGILDLSASSFSAFDLLLPASAEAIYTCELTLRSD